MFLCLLISLFTVLLSLLNNILMMPNIIGILIITATLFTVNTVGTVTFCSSLCPTACTTPSASNCTTCISPLVGSSSSCVGQNQTSLFLQQLAFSISFSTSGYSSNQPLSVAKCTGLFDYYLLGLLGTNSYVYKQYTGLGVNHYQITVLYGYGLLGPTWSALPINFQMKDGQGNIVSDPQSPSCNPDALTGCIASNIGCFVDYLKVNSIHKSDFLSLNFSSMGTTIPATNSWGVKDIAIILSLCDSTCLTCTDQYNTNCTSCVTGLYLQGSVCIAFCAFYTIPSTGMCVVSCPITYFLNSLNNYCQSCAPGCLTCTSPSNCLSWDNASDTSNIFYDLIQLWIILMVLGIVLIGLLVWKLCLSKKSFYNTMEEEVIDHKPVKQQKIANQSTESIQAHWINDIDKLHMTKSKTKDTILGIGKAK